MNALATADLAEAWRELERIRREGWHLSMTTSIDFGWEWRATFRAGRRFGQTVHGTSRDPVEAIQRLVAAVEAAA